MLKTFNETGTGGLTSHSKLCVLNQYFSGNLADRIAFCFLVPFWPGLGLPRPKAIVVIPQNQPLPKHLRKKNE